MYGVLAFAVISQIVSLLRLNFGRDSQYPMSHSSYTNLYLDLIGFVFLHGRHVGGVAGLYLFQAVFHRRHCFSTVIDGGGGDRSNCHVMR